MSAQPQAVKVVPGPLLQDGQISLDHVRHFLMDRSAADNSLDLDLFYSDDEIKFAMSFAAMSFNEMTPYSITVNAAKLPFGMCFLYGISYHLYLSKLQKLMRNDLDYTAAGTAVDIDKRRIKYMQDALPVFKQEFDRLTKDQKLNRNLQNAYGHF